MVRVFSKRGQEFVCFLPSDIPETREDIVMDDEGFLDIPGLLTQLKRRCILAVGHSINPTSRYDPSLPSLLESRLVVLQILPWQQCDTVSCGR